MEASCCLTTVSWLVNQSEIRFAAHSSNGWETMKAVCSGHPSPLGERFFLLNVDGSKTMIETAGVARITDLE